MTAQQLTRVVDSGEVIAAFANQCSCVIDWYHSNQS